jgi:chromosome segregation ATPase
MLYAEQTAWHADVTGERQRLVDDRDKFDREVAKKKQVLRQRREDLDRRRDAIKRLREEVADAQRETLEMRLATEELWARMSGTTPTAVITQSLAELRRKLAVQHQRARAELVEQRNELTGLATRLGEEREKLIRQRCEMQDWFNNRSSELAEQTAALVAREQQLDQQDTAMQRTKYEHNEERRAYQRELRKLLTQLRELEGRAAAA